MTKANCIIFSFVIKMLLGGNNFLVISPQEQSSDNVRITNAIFNLEPKIPLLPVGLTSLTIQLFPTSRH